MKFYNKPKELSLQRFFTYYIYTVIILCVPTVIYLFDVIKADYLVLAVALFIIADFSLFINIYFLIKRTHYKNKFIANNNINYIELFEDRFDVVYCDNSTKIVYDKDIDEANLNISFAKTSNNILARALGYQSSDIRKIELNLVSRNNVYVVCDECFGGYAAKYRTIFKGIDLLKNFSKFNCDVVGHYKASVAEKINTYLNYGYFKFISNEYKPKAIFTSVIFLIISVLFVLNMFRLNSKEDALMMLGLGVLCLVPVFVIAIMFLIDNKNRKEHVK